jgi:hypothetical protein
MKNEAIDTTTGEIIDTEWGGTEHTKEFMMGDLLNACMKRFKSASVVWTQMSEDEQTRFLGYVHDDLTAAVKKAVDIIASNGRVTFRAEVESVQFKGPTDVKSVLKLVNSPQSHSLADAAGAYVTVVIEQLDDLLSIPDSALFGEPDNKPLFDAKHD